MEEAVAVRRAALAAVEDVEPVRLRDRIEARIDAASMAPGVYALVSARAVCEDAVERGSTSPGSAWPCEDAPDGLADRAAGVQLIYEGLRLTRSLAHEDPWSGLGDESDARDEANLDILIADILVSRGFYLLARTEAADAAVGVVRAFGTDQTVRRETDDPSLDRNLEADVLELAALAGVTAGGARSTTRLREYTADLAADADPLPAVERLTDDEIRETVAALVADEASTSDGVTTSADY
ncbi:DUF7114 family protein [Halomicrobium urmianum]|uniref:DUF7114 family protein n=1 Tax=Halomicrobium urmianum TaxID=1586233 RepID=UPI0027E43667|nr:hypothetical protein [Halomicrobium urmianum]